MDHYFKQHWLDTSVSGFFVNELASLEGWSKSLSFFKDNFLVGFEKWFSKGFLFSSTFLFKSN